TDAWPNHESQVWHLSEFGLAQGHRCPNDRGLCRLQIGLLGSAYEGEVRAEDRLDDLGGDRTESDDAANRRMCFGHGTTTSMRRRPDRSLSRSRAERKSSGVSTHA